MIRLGRKEIILLASAAVLTALSACRPKTQRVKLKDWADPTHFLPPFQDESGANVTRVMLNVTEMRINAVYMTYVNWSQSIVLGFIPAVMLMYFNTKIYLDIR